MSFRNLLGRGRRDDEPESDDEVDVADEVDGEDGEPASDVGAEDTVDDPTADERDAAGEGTVDDSDEHVDEQADDDGEVEGDEDDGAGHDQVEFDLPEFGGREIEMLDAELDAMRIRRAWQAGTLIVNASDADVVDDLIDLVEDRIGLDLPPDAEPVIYDVGDWPVGLEDRFIEALIDERIRHQRGYHEVTVGVDDEERVDALVDEVTAAWEDEQVPEDEQDEPDAQEVLSELFVTADRLQHGPSDKAAVVRFDDAATLVKTMRVPFGFDEATWQPIVDGSVALHDLLAEADSSDEDIVEAASDLRGVLRPLV